MEVDNDPGVAGLDRAAWPAEAGVKDELEVTKTSVDVGLRRRTAPLVVAPLMGTGACRPGGAVCWGWLCSLDLPLSLRPKGPSENLARGTSGLRTMTGESRRGTIRRGDGSCGSGEGGVGDTSMGGGVEAADDGGLLVALRGRGKESEEGVVG